MSNEERWTLLTYRIPSQPTRLRLSIWRKLQALGAVYLQDAICLLPDRNDLTENLLYVAQAIEEMGGTCHVFRASSLLPTSDTRLIADFQALADQRMGEIAKRLDQLSQQAMEADLPNALEPLEEELKKERVAYLRARRLNYFGSHQDEAVETGLDAVRDRLDTVLRESK